MNGKFVLDTSVIIDGIASGLVEKGEIGSGSEIIVPIAALDELQAQASRHREEGFVGLNELTKLRSVCSEKNVKLSFEGQRPSMEDIRLAANGRIDAIIRDFAKDSGGTLLTADYVQALVGEAQGISVKHFRSEIRTSDLEFEKFFDDQTLSVHLKEELPPYSKRGVPGNFVYGPIGDKPVGVADLEQIVKQLSEATRVSRSGSVEISRSGATVIQLGQYRIAIARPPFSDGLEVTIVRPLVKLSLGDYHLSEKLEDRLANQAEGILIAGPPGSGKSTLASSLADFFLSNSKVVKTFESPKDLQVSPGVTQYGALEGDFEKTAEILLLVRPDYTIYDEVRKTKDFQVFSDMRLAGVGMVGVVHASDPINAVQRFMGRIELGMIPHIIDTVIFVKAGRIEQALSLKLVVKVPSGMNEPDLARPVVEVSEFETGKLVFEIYTFGEENVIIPIESGSKQKNSSGIENLAKDRILQVVRKFDPRAEVSIISPQKVEIRVDESVVPRIIGRGGAQIKELEDMLKVHIDVESRNNSGEQVQEYSVVNGPPIDYQFRQRGSSLEFVFSPSEVGRNIQVLIEGEPVLRTTINRKGIVIIPKKSENGKRILRTMKGGGELAFVPT